jgi:site-specific DNA recombinase
MNSKYSHPNPTYKAVILYARVSTDEQTKGNYPSCLSQIEELEAYCKARGWSVFKTITDEGYSAGSLKRPGLTELRWHVGNGDADAVVCTWYDRLTRSREFYTLDAEFKKHNISFITLHDRMDTSTAAGRFMESMIVAAKTYEREETGEKVSEKMRMRAEKGMWNGGHTPYGFLRDYEHKTIVPDPEKIPVLEQMFRVYVETQSDFKVRDWLKAHQILSWSGKSEWAVGSIRDLLTNRVYIGEIEINRRNKGVEGLPEKLSYAVGKAAFGPLVPVELFEMAQAIREEKAKKSPNRIGRPRSYSQTQCGRVYPLQGLLYCSCCGHSMTPWYVHHKPGKHRRKESFIHYYVCAKQLKGWKQCDHKNLILSRVCEEWVMERIADLVERDGLLERAFDHARQNSASTLQPEKEALELTREALRANQEQLDGLVEAVSSGRANAALFDVLNERALNLKLERERLRAEEKRLQEALNLTREEFDAEAFRATLADFRELAGALSPAEVQQLMRLLVRRIEWKPEGGHRLELHYLPKPQAAKTQKSSPEAGKDWLYTDARLGCPLRTTFEPVLYRMQMFAEQVTKILNSCLKLAA